MHLKFIMSERKGSGRVLFSWLLREGQTFRPFLSLLMYSGFKTLFREIQNTIVFVKGAKLGILQLEAALFGKGKPRVLKTSCSQGRHCSAT